MLGGAARVVWVVRAVPPPAGAAPRVAVHGWRGEDDDDDQTGRALAMAPDAEAATAGRLAGVCAALATRLRGAGGSEAVSDDFFAAEHARLARDYIEARTRLLEWAAEGLRDQAAGWAW